MLFPQHAFCVAIAYLNQILFVVVDSNFSGLYLNKILFFWPQLSISMSEICVGKSGCKKIHVSSQLPIPTKLVLLRQVDTSTGNIFIETTCYEKDHISLQRVVSTKNIFYSNK
jgi:hypothetical protein